MIGGETSAGTAEAVFSFSENVELPYVLINSRVFSCLF